MPVGGCHQSTGNVDEIYRCKTEIRLLDKHNREEWRLLHTVSALCISALVLPSAPVFCNAPFPSKLTVSGALSCPQCSSSVFASQRQYAIISFLAGPSDVHFTPPHLRAWILTSPLTRAVSSNCVAQRSGSYVYAFLLILPVERRRSKVSLCVPLREWCAVCEG
ncbi:hypothetical protein BV25DRAFT_1826657 [Artomyces pyxidatus]|uniref:Uncharacterized protein n=1 Tax=Artomyces pyxidatus TaxID=48021 RepID=A0ACB8SYD8_9AGAM|nr:hypothetical protein BV25DRAFT_1826657 [Artomyces pyxidatus]